MKSRYFVVTTVVFVFFLVFILPGLIALGITIKPENDQAGFDVNLKRSIYAEHKITQQFTSPKNNLTAIGISIGNPNLKNRKSINLILKDSSLHEIRKTTINGANVGDGAFVKFRFDPIADSEGKSYLFELSTEDANSEEVIYAFYSTEVKDFVGPSIFGEEVNEKGLPIVLYYSAPDRLETVKEIYSSWFSRLLR